MALGASSYGMLTTFVKMAYNEGFTTAEVTISQYVLGALGLLFLNLILKNKETPIVYSLKPAFKLMLAGTSTGLTSVFLYLAVQHVSVGIGIVLLMQTVWMGVIVEMIIYKKLPGIRKLFAVLIVLGGTILTTTVGQGNVNIEWIGIIWGLMAALSYTATMYSSNSISLQLPALKRSFFMIAGGLVMILLIFHAQLSKEFSFGIFFRWGIFLSLFGTILPPILLTRGMPLIGIGLGAIISSLEIPVSVLMAFLFINENITLVQWIGVGLILAAVVVMNIPQTKSSRV